MLDNSFGNVKFTADGTILPFSKRGRGTSVLIIDRQSGRPKDESSNRNQQHKMHNYCKTIGALAAVSALAAGNVSAEVEYELHTGYSNEYLFRGRNLGQDLVEVGADVKGQYAGLDLRAGAWYGNVQNAQIVGPNNVSFDQLNLYAGVGKDLGFATGEVGYISRQYSNDLDSIASLYDNEQEIFFSLSRQFWGVDTSIAYFWDIEEDNDGYAELALNKGWELSPCVTLNTGGDVGYLAEQGQFTAITLRTSLDWGFANNAKLSPFIAYSIALSDDWDTAYFGSKNQFIGGVMLSVGF